MIYFSSDWHIGHDKPFIYEPRGFKSIEQHDTEILLRCNEIVGPEDTLYILGDLAMSSNEKEWNRVYKALVCQDVHFIWGNHDTDNKIDKYIHEYNLIYEGMAKIFKYTKRKSFYLSHYPTIVSNYGEENRFFWNLSGHTHTKERFHSQYPIYNVSLDAHKNFPVSIEEIIRDIDIYTRG